MSTRHRSLLIGTLLVALLLSGIAPAHAAGNPLVSIHPAALPGFPNSGMTGLWIAFQNQMFFFGTNAAGDYDLWQSNGTVGNTTLVKALGLVSPMMIDTIGGAFFFSADSGIWRSDGTAAGTTLLTSAAALLSDYPPVVLQNQLLFVGHDASGYELWKSDGTVAGTALVKDINPAGNAIAPYISMINFRMFAVAGRYLYVDANDGVHGHELWQSDGSATGTTLVKDLIPSATDMTDIQMVGVLGDAMIFRIRDIQQSTMEIWRTDGSAAGTIMLTSNITISDHQPGVTVGGKVFFRAYSDAYQSELWESDGTPAGTNIVKDVAPGSGIGGGSFPTNLTAFNGQIFFAARDINNPPGGTFNNEQAGLWRTDGSDAGTVRVTQGLYGYANGVPSDLTATGNRLFYIDRSELYVVDAATMSSSKVGTFGYGATSNGFVTNIAAAADGVAFFSVVTRDSQGITQSSSLWRSDGTTAGTVLLQPALSMNSSLLAGRNMFLFGVGQISDLTRTIWAGSLADLLATHTTVSSQGGEVRSLDGQTSLTFPAGSVAGDTNVELRSLATPTQTVGSRHALRSFTLTASDGAGAPVTQFAQPYSLVVNYTDAELAALGLSESSLNLAFWDGSAWTNLLPCAGCSVDTVNNTVTVKLNHFTEFAMLGAVEYKSYLPLVWR